MLVTVDPDSAIGLAEQIAGQVRGAVSAGRLVPGERLPAARELANDLGVNMHTVLRAYGALRDEGLIELRRGRGAAVRSDVEPGAVDLERQVRDLVAAAARLGISREQLARRVQGSPA